MVLRDFPLRNKLTNIRIANNEQLIYNTRHSVIYKTKRGNNHVYQYQTNNIPNLI